jgi:hypothetical protein
MGLKLYLQHFYSTHHTDVGLITVYRSFSHLRLEMIYYVLLALSLFNIFLYICESRKIDTERLSYEGNTKTFKQTSA